MATKKSKMTKNTNKSSNNKSTFDKKNKSIEFVINLFSCGFVVVLLLIISLMFSNNICYNIWFDKLSIEERHEYLSGETSKLIGGAIENFEITSINKTKTTVKLRGRGAGTMEVPAYTFVYEDRYGKEYTEKDLWVNDETSSQIILGDKDLYIIDENKICAFKYLQLTEETMRNLGIADEYGIEKNEDKDKDAHFR